MTGVELLIGALIAWAVRKARRVGERVDGQVDQVLDAGVDRLGELVTGKLAADPSLAKLEAEAAAGEVSKRTQQRVQLAVEDAVEQDQDFAAALEDALRQLEAAAPKAGPGGVTVLGGVTIRAEHGSNAAWSITAPVTIGVQLRPDHAAGSDTAGGTPPDPPVPGRP